MVETQLRAYLCKGWLTLLLELPSVLKHCAVQQLQLKQGVKHITVNFVSRYDFFFCWSQES